MEIKPLFTTIFPCAITLLFVSCNEDPADNSTSAESEQANAAQNQSAPTTPAEKKVFVLSDSSKIDWVGSNSSGNHAGGFGNFTGKFEIAAGEIMTGGRHFITIDMASIFTDDEELTNQLKGRKYFNTRKFPIARFQMRKAELKEGSDYQVSGMLDMNGAAKKISFPASIEINGKETLLDMKAEISINLKDFGVVKSDSESEESINDEVVLNLAATAMPGEPQELVLMDKTEGENSDGRPGRGKGGKGGKGWGKGKGEDWRNMSEEERAQKRKEMVVEMDKNKDGQLGKDEAPERLWNFLSRADKNGDDKLSEQERSDFRTEMRAERELRELTGEGGGRGGKGGKGGDR